MSTTHFTFMSSGIRLIRVRAHELLVRNQTFVWFQNKLDRLHLLLPLISFVQSVIYPSLIPWSSLHLSTAPACRCICPCHCSRERSRTFLSTAKFTFHRRSRHTGYFTNCFNSTCSSGTPRHLFVRRQSTVCSDCLSPHQSHRPVRSRVVNLYVANEAQPGAFVTQISSTAVKLRFVMVPSSPLIHLHKTSFLIPLRRLSFSCAGDQFFSPVSPYYYTDDYSHKLATHSTSP